MSSAKKRGLGRGLDALLTPQVRASVQDSDTDNADSTPRDGDLSKIAINRLSPGKYQPRKDMSDVALEELSLSIQSQGIIQTIVARFIDDDVSGEDANIEGRYEIIAG